MEVYPLTKADPTATLTLLGTLVPDAQVAPRNGRHAHCPGGRGRPRGDQGHAREAPPEGPDPNAPQLQFYPFEKVPPASLTTILANLVPKAEVTVDPEEQRLVVMATPSDHEIVRATIEHFQEATPDSKPLLVVYPMRSVDSASLLTLLTSLVPKGAVDRRADDGQPGRLGPCRGARDHSRHGRPASAGDAGPGHARAPFPRAGRRAAGRDGDRPPRAGPEGADYRGRGQRRLMVVASAAEQETIEKTVAEFETIAADKPVLRFHPMAERAPGRDGDRPPRARPKAQITVDTGNKRLMVIASAADHETIQSTVAEFEDQRLHRARAPVSSVGAGTRRPT